MATVAVEIPPGDCKNCDWSAWAFCFFFYKFPMPVDCLIVKTTWGKLKKGLAQETDPWVLHVFFSLKVNWVRLWLLRLYYTDSLLLWGALRSLELFCKTFLNGEQYSLLLTFTLWGEGGDCFSLFLLLCPLALLPPSALIWVDGVAVAWQDTSGPLREKAGSLLLGLFSLRDHVPPTVTPGTSRRAPPLTLFMPSLAGMQLVYLLWPAARVKGTFWPRSGRGHLRMEQ